MGRSSIDYEVLRGQTQERSHSERPAARHVAEADRGGLRQGTDDSASLALADSSYLASSFRASRYFLAPRL